jgi:hypothetical protein
VIDKVRLARMHKVQLREEEEAEDEEEGGSNCSSTGIEVGSAGLAEVAAAVGR